MPEDRDAHLRSIFKAVSYRVLASIAMAVIVFILLSLDVMPHVSTSKKFMISLSAGILEAIVKIVFYYLHERLWTHISFGRKIHPLSSLDVNKPLEEDDMEIIRSKLKDLGYIDEE